MNILDKMKREIITGASKAAGMDAGNYIEQPDKEGFGDFSLPCFHFAKDTGKNPIEIAKELEKKITVKNANVKAVGPYVNFYINWSAAAGRLLKTIDDNYGKGRAKETVLMDVFQANPFKSFHIGHVKNAVLGDSVRRILEYSGKKTICVTFNGDVGIHVARWMLYFRKYHKGPIPKKNFTKWSGEIYAAASQKAKDDEKFEEEAQELNRRIDKRDKKIIKQWKKMRDLCYKDYDRIQKELDVKVDYRIPESECEKPGKKLVEKLFRDGRLAKSEGAIGIDLGELGFFMLLKSDGTALYQTKDFGLLQLKKKKGKFGRMIYVVGSEQDFYFRQLFKAFDILGLYPMKKSTHVSHGLVQLKEGKMASRLGNVILYEDLRDEAVSRVSREIKKRGAKLRNKKETAKKIALAAIKFSMLHVENRNEIKFDWDEALNFEGRSGPYLQYSYVRASSILEKAKRKPGTFDSRLLDEGIEIRLIKQLAKFPHAADEASKQCEPYIIANYLFGLSQDFNSFYNSLPVLRADKKTRAARLKLVEAISIVLRNGMNLLGIEAVKKM